MLEIQGDLATRGDTDLNGKFIGDLMYNKFGQPVSLFRLFIKIVRNQSNKSFSDQILIIGHHILFGKEQKMNKPLAVIEKVNKPENMDESLNCSQMEKSLLDSTINIENRTKVRVQYEVRSLIKKKLVFKQRPKPIIANVPKKV